MDTFLDEFLTPELLNEHQLNEEDRGVILEILKKYEIYSAKKRIEGVNAMGNLPAAKRRRLGQATSSIKPSIQPSIQPSTETAASTFPSSSTASFPSSSTASFPSSSSSSSSTITASFPSTDASTSSDKYETLDFSSLPPLQQYLDQHIVPQHSYHHISSSSTIPTASQQSYKSSTSTLHTPPLPSYHSSTLQTPLQHITPPQQITYNAPSSTLPSAQVLHHAPPTISSLPPTISSITPLTHTSLQPTNNYQPPPTNNYQPPIIKPAFDLPQEPERTNDGRPLCPICFDIFDDIKAIKKHLARDSCPEANEKGHTACPVCGSAMGTDLKTICQHWLSHFLVPAKRGRPKGATNRQPSN